MIADLHVHTTFCDGANTPEEMVLAAIEKNLGCIGFSAHSYVDFDSDYCLTPPTAPQYRDEIYRLKEKYRGKIKILFGLEQDFVSAPPEFSCDYTIGSVHYVECGGRFLPIDIDLETTKNIADKYFGGDFYALCEKYYSYVGDIIEKTNADIIGHFDLIKKYNLKNCLFDEKNERYIRAYRAAIDKLIAYGRPFEINTSAISKGLSEPYPSCDILKYLQKKGAKVILSSDSHTAASLAFEFGKWEKYCRDLGLDIFRPDF